MTPKRRRIYKIGEGDMNVESQADGVRVYLTNPKGRIRFQLIGRRIELLAREVKR